MVDTTVSAPATHGTQVGASIRLSEQEVRDYTGYSQPARQLAVLHSMGFHRATLDRFGKVRLERTHFEAVCNSAAERPRPKVKPATSVRPKVRQQQ